MKATRAVGRRYARALLTIASEEDAVARTEQEMAALGAALAENDELDQAMRNPVVAVATKQAVAKEILERTQASDLFQRFVALLLEKGRFGALALIADEYRKLADAELGRLRAHVRAASEIPSDVQGELASRLSTLTGQRVEIEHQVDPSLLGGVVAEVGGVVYDASLRSRLGDLMRGESL